MKAVSVTPQPDGACSMRLYADSAIGRDVQPLFIPDLAQQWLCRVCVAVRIGRLGKCISEKFAHRYVSDIGLVAVIEPDTSCEQACALVSEGELSIMDSALTTGRWIEGAMPSDTSTVQVNDTALTVDWSAAGIDRIISRVSRGATLKTGDIIILPDVSVTVPLTADTFISAMIDGQQCLHIKVK